MNKEEFNGLVVDLFHQISYEEEKAIITDEFKDISNKDLHIINAIGYDSSKNMSSIAKLLNITVGTLTIAINNLLKKGYVIRTRSDKDRRVVFICLSEKGKKAFLHHQSFHIEMIGGLLDELSQEEEAVLIKTLQYFKNYYSKKK